MLFFNKIKGEKMQNKILSSFFCCILALNYAFADNINGGGGD